MHFQMTRLALGQGDAVNIHFSRQVQHPRTHLGLIG